jgi:hypothetical protein
VEKKWKRSEGGVEEVMLYLLCIVGLGLGISQSAASNTPTPTQQRHRQEIIYHHTAPAHPRTETVVACTEGIDGFLTTVAMIIEKEIRGGDMECLYLLG